MVSGLLACQSAKCSLITHRLSVCLLWEMSERKRGHNEAQHCPVYQTSILAKFLQTKVRYLQINIEVVCHDRNDILTPFLRYYPSLM